ncbi:hypothetical protein KCU91_g636, partial [Aureobasidium melanogenum]
MRLNRRRLFRRISLRYLIVALILFVVLALVEAFNIHSALEQASLEEPNAFGQQKIFIVGIHWNNENILRDHWIPAVVALARDIGPQNVFVSIYESGSYDNTKAVLQWLDHALEENGIPRRVILDETTHADEISKPLSDSGWIETPNGTTQLRRIPYLAKSRNIAMEPLYELQDTNVVFDKILFLNDVVFTTPDVQKLISTRDGDYAAACALDFSKPPAFYDTFALRDSEGHEAATTAWPYFRSRASREALKHGKPTPVESCWNGIVAMNAKPFYQTPRLIFRGVSDSLAKLHVEGSECCLIHTDNPLSAEQGVWNWNTEENRDSRIMIDRVRHGLDLFGRADELYDRIEDNKDVPSYITAQYEQKGRFKYLLNRDGEDAGFDDVSPAT